MQEDLLDEPYEEKDFKYAKRSFRLFLWTLGIFGLLFLFTLFPISWIGRLPELGRDLLFGIPVFAMLITCSGGFKQALVSLRKKEPWQYQKIVGLIGNAIFIALFLLMMITNVMDVMKVIS